MKAFSIFFSAAMIFFILFDAWVHYFEATVIATFGVIYAIYLTKRAWTDD